MASIVTDLDLSYFRFAPITLKLSDSPGRILNCVVRRDPEQVQKLVVLAYT